MSGRYSSPSAPSADLIVVLPTVGNPSRRRSRGKPPVVPKCEPSQFAPGPRPPHGADADFSYDPDRLLNVLRDTLKLRTDAALAAALQVAAPSLSKVRRRRAGVSAALLLAMHDVTGMTIRDLRCLMGDQRKYFSPLILEMIQC